MNVDLAAMNPDLASERRNLQFNVPALTNLVYGGEKKVAMRHAIVKYVESRPDFNDPNDIAFMNREERMENAARKAVAMFKEELPFELEDLSDMLYFKSLVIPSDVSPFDLQYVASMPYFQGQADEEQFNKWMPLFLTRAINTAYAQTELGHGTNLRQLETTATYDAAKQEFIINTPTLTATKWWSGNLGKSTSHAIVMAQLYTRGDCYGIHAFLVPIRDPDTFKVLPGIQLGDIGPKFGMPSNDNGFTRFTNVRIPRENMLMRHAKVLPDGTYVPPVHLKLSYGGMVFIRSFMISMMSYGLARACTIAIRYSCVRRQGNDQQLENSGRNNTRQLENRILDYQTQQYRLFPELAKAYALHFVGVHMRTMYNKISKELRQGDVSNLAQLHALSAGIKAVLTREAALGIEICRLACGGHGYSVASGLPDIYADTVAGCTYEGDNIILLLQTARALIKQAKSESVLHPVSSVRKDPSRPFTLSELLQAYHNVAKGTRQETATLLDDLKKRGHTNEQAWDKRTVELCRMAKANVRAFVVENFVNVVSEKGLDSSVNRVLTLLCELYAVCGIQAHAGDFMEFAGFAKADIRSIRDRCYELLAAIRPAAVQLVDAFEFHDRELRSALGRYDGHVYEALFEWAKNSPLNRVEVLSSFPKHIGPHMREARSKL